MNSIHGAYSEAEVESRMPWLSDLEDLALIHQKVSKWEWLLHTVLYLFEFMMLHLESKYRYNVELFQRYTGVFN